MQTVIEKRKKSIFPVKDDFKSVDEYQMIFHAAKSPYFEMQLDDIIRQPIETIVSPHRKTVFNGKKL